MNDSCGNPSCIEHGVDRLRGPLFASVEAERDFWKDQALQFERKASSLMIGPEANEWWQLRCLEDAVRNIDKLVATMSTDYDALSEAFRRKHNALARLEELRNG